MDVVIYKKQTNKQKNPEVLENIEKSKRKDKISHN